MIFIDLKEIRETKNLVINELDNYIISLESEANIMAKIIIRNIIKINGDIGCDWDIKSGDKHFKAWLIYQPFYGFYGDRINKINITLKRGIFTRHLCGDYCKEIYEKYKEEIEKENQELKEEINNLTNENNK